MGVQMPANKNAFIWSAHTEHVNVMEHIITMVQYITKPASMILNFSLMDGNAHKCAQYTPSAFYLDFRVAEIAPHLPPPHTHTPASTPQRFALGGGTTVSPTQIHPVWCVCMCGWGGVEKTLTALARRYDQKMLHWACEYTPTKILHQ